MFILIPFEKIHPLPPVPTLVCTCESGEAYRHFSRIYTCLLRFGFSDWTINVTKVENCSGNLVFEKAHAFFVVILFDYTTPKYVSYPFFTKIHKCRLFLDGFRQINTQKTIIYIIYISRGYMSLTLPCNNPLSPIFAFLFIFSDLRSSTLNFL